ncbi:MAG: hypothetical protein ACKO35_05785, partial [Planctomycetaceae bacterium]
MTTQRSTTGPSASGPGDPLRICRFRRPRGSETGIGAVTTDDFVIDLASAGLGSLAAILDADDPTATARSAVVQST